MKRNDEAHEKEEGVVIANGAAQEKSNAFSWGVLAKLFAGIAAVGGLVLHMMGYISHRTYLSAWGLDPGLFPKPADAIIIHGFYAVVDRTVTMLTVINESGEKLLLAVIAMATLLFISVGVSRIGGSGQDTRIHRYFSRLPKWCGDLFASMAVAFSALAVVPVVLAFAVIVLAIPALLGENYGQVAATRERASYEPGCQKKAGAPRCVELRKDGKIAVRGFLIESSESHIAMFDVAEKRARALERSGTELFADPMQ